MIPVLLPGDPFPSTQLALSEPNGLLALGGDLSADTLKIAYSKGIFPWYEASQPIMWWSPTPRCVLSPRDIKISRSLKKTLKKETFTVTRNTAFQDVINQCGTPRSESIGTWLHHDMIEAYKHLYDLNICHSIETWKENKLVGGLYGVLLNNVFFGESMFSLVSDASKVALVKLCEWLSSINVRLIDCQVESSHLLSMGAHLITRGRFEQLLDKNITI
jgi:leucyl/phenylalanyl-tRNA--protein transferase